MSAYDQRTPVQIHTNVIELYTLYTNAMRVSIGKTNFCRRILKSGINIRSKSKKYVLLGVDKNGKSDYNIIRKQAQTDDVNCRAESRNSKNSRTLFGAIIKRYKI